MVMQDSQNCGHSSPRRGEASCLSRPSPSPSPSSSSRRSSSSYHSNGSYAKLVQSLVVVLSVAVALSCLVSVVEASTMFMDVMPSTTRCVGQELDEEDMAVFTFGADHVNDGTYDSNVIAAHKDIQKITASIEDPKGNYLVENEVLLINSKRPIEKVVHHTQTRGVFHVCFTLFGGEIPVRSSFHIEFQSKDAKTKLKTSSSKIEKDEVPVAEAKLQLAEDTLHVIQKEIEYAKLQETALKDSSEAVSDRIHYFSMLSMAVLVVTSIWQLVYLRSFFTSKKLL